ADAPLCNMPYSERSFLKPIQFVHAAFTPFLFRQSEELLEPLSEEVGTTEESYVPPAEHVVQVFTGTQRVFPADSESEDEASGQLEEIDFADLGKICAEVDAVPAPTEGLDQSANGAFAEAPDVLVVEEESPSSSSGPFTKRIASDAILVDLTGDGEMLGEENQLIVYVAPHRRSGRASPVSEVPRVKLPTTSLLTGKSSSFTTGEGSPMQEGEDDVYCVPNGVAPRQAQTKTWTLSSLTLDFSSPGIAKQPRFRPVFTPAERKKAALKARTKEARIQRLRQHSNGRSAFGSFGTMLSEARLREEDDRERRHPKWETRRRGDSDVDWGLMGRVMGGVMVIRRWVRVSSGLGGMDLDLDVELGMDAMKGFLRSMGVEGSHFVTMDDIEDEARMRREDEEDQGGPTGSSDSEPSDEDEDEDREEHEENEEEGAFNVEEELLIADPEEEVNPATDDNDGEGTSVDSSEDDDGKRSPGSSFQARLRKIRERGRSMLSKVARQVSDDDDSDDSLDDEEFTAQINDILEEHSDIVTGHNRKQRKQLFRNLHQGYVDEYNLEEPMDTQSVALPVKKGKKAKAKAGYFVDELQARWERDRAKKAEYKRQRHEARLQAAVDPFSNHKGGKKARKAMLAASKLNPEDLVSMVPNAIVDMASLEAQIRRFVDDIGGKPSMALPAMDKSSRKNVHELAAAFGLSSQSKGNGVRRYTTLMKTTRTGIVKEGKVKAIMKRFGNTFDRAYYRKNGGDSKGRLPRHREGDEVGKEAPKIGESNIGFRMLASMGWSEGDRIGGNASVGIEAPVAAIIKISKLGLGATR
ncbi:hypothetical protein BU15DRAFT_54890, partial [Melanogaster broomeanus]